MTKMLLGFEPSIIDQVNNSKDTSLHYAMISDSGIPMIEILLRGWVSPACLLRASCVQLLCVYFGVRTYIQWCIGALQNAKIYLYRGIFTDEGIVNV